MTETRSITTRIGLLLRSRQSRTPLLAALLSAGLFVFYRLTAEMLEGEYQWFDDAVLLTLRRPDDPSLPIGPAWLVQVMTDISGLGGVTTLALVTLLATLYLLLDRKRQMAGLVAGGVIGGWALSTLLKYGIDRPRPEVVPHLVAVHDPSFPSGHAMLSAVTYLTLGVLLARTRGRRALRLFTIGAAFLLTLLIGISRIYLGVHYPTDVLGGWCAGVSWALFCWLAAHLVTTGRAASSIQAG